MRLLDLFCGAGGCSVGYHRAGFTDIVGVDIKPQKSYPFTFVQGDALEYAAKHGHEFDAVHASPPCQRYSAMTTASKNRSEHPDLVEPTRQLLKSIGKPWVMENVPGAPFIDPIILCGTFFGLRVIRHRLFESSAYLMAPGVRCRHPKPGSVGKAGRDCNKKPGDWVSVAGNCTLRVAAPAMGIDWMRNRNEIAQAIPPAYTEYIGKQILAHLGVGQ